MQSAHLTGLIRIGFFTGSDIILVQAGDLHPLEGQKMLSINCIIPE